MKGMRLSLLALKHELARVSTFGRLTPRENFAQRADKSRSDPARHRVRDNSLSGNSTRRFRCTNGGPRVVAEAEEIQAGAASPAHSFAPQGAQSSRPSRVPGRKRPGYVKSEQGLFGSPGF